MDENDRTAALSSFNPEEIDGEFIPYLQRINQFPDVVSTQCCSGHLEYKSTPDAIVKQPGRWGYLQLLTDVDLAEWLCETVRDCDWLLFESSQMWDEKAGMAPCVTKNQSYGLTFAWDATQWPRPAEEICGLIEEYYARRRDSDE
jgi:hypothetical protein